jgi:ABC-type lipoprotein release transport system permease subunit
MLFNYISTSIVSKRQSIGVLRALGTGGKSIFLMFLLEGLTIALIGGLLASLVSYIACIFVNEYILEVMNLTIKFVLFGGRQIAIIVASSLATGFMASLIPIIRIVKEKPVALIRKD